MPKIIITGRNFTEPDDGALQMLKNARYEVIDLGKLGMAHGTPEKEVAEAVKDADAVIAGLEPYTEGVLSVCPKLKLISRRGIGYDSVDVEACHRHGVTLCRTAGMVEGSVAEQVMAYILYFARRIDLQNQYMQEGQWKRLMMPGVKTRTLGLVGFGGIGKEIARRAAAFDMEILYYCRHPKKGGQRQGPACSFRRCGLFCCRRTACRWSGKSDDLRLCRPRPFASARRRRSRGRLFQVEPALPPGQCRNPIPRQTDTCRGT